MNLVELQNKYLPDENLREEFTRQKNNELKTGKSLVAYLADKFVTAGTEGLREIVTRLEKSGISQPLSKEPYLELPEEIRQQIRFHHAAIVFGVTVSSIEDTLVCGEFDIKDWCDRYNFAIHGTSLAPVRVTKDFEPVSPQQLKLMYSAIVDKTFGKFFELNSPVIPSFLAALLESSGALPHIKRTILPMFLERAQLLVATPTPTA